MLHSHKFLLRVSSTADPPIQHKEKKTPNQITNLIIIPLISYHGVSKNSMPVFSCYYSNHQVGRELDPGKVDKREVDGFPWAEVAEVEVPQEREEEDNGEKHTKKTSTLDNGRTHSAKDLLKSALHKVVKGL